MLVRDLVFLDVVHDALLDPIDGRRVLLDFLVRRRAEHDVRFRSFACALVGDTDDACVGDVFVSEQEAFQFGGLASISAVLIRKRTEETYCNLIALHFDEPADTASVNECMQPDA